MYGQAGGDYMQARVNLKIDEHPGLGRLYRNHGRRPISGQIDVRVLGEYGTIDVAVENLRPLGGDVAAPSGPLAAAASPIAYQVWLISEAEGESLILGGFNADGDGVGRFGLDFDPSNVCRSNIDINGFEHFAIPPMIENGGGVGPITVAFAALPGDLATFRESHRSVPPSPHPDAEEKVDNFEITVEDDCASHPEPPRETGGARRSRGRQKHPEDFDRKDPE